MGCDVRCPAVNCTNPTIPNFECPALNCPDVTLPGVKCGDVKEGDLHCPNINFGGLKCEPMKCADINFPEFNCPSLKCTDLTLNCPQCIDNSLGIVIMVTVLVSLTLILVFIYKMKQISDQNKRYRHLNVPLRQKNKKESVPEKNNLMALSSRNNTNPTDFAPLNEEIQALGTDVEKKNREFDFKKIKMDFENKTNEKI